MDDRHILEQVAKKLLTRSANEEEEEKNQFLADLKTNIGSSDASEYSKIEEAGLSLTPDQSVALEKMKQFVQTPRQTYFRLTGAAPSEQNARRAG